MIEIGDLSKEESIKYLIKKRKVKEAKRLYELVGGRIIDLKSVADKFLDGKSFEGKINFLYLHQIYITLFFYIIKLYIFNKSSLLLTKLD